MSSFISDHLSKRCINKLINTGRGQTTWSLYAVDQGFLCFNWSHCIAVVYCLVFSIGSFEPEHLIALIQITTIGVISILRA